MKSKIIKTAAAICKTIMRNGFEAYIINAILQEKACILTGKPEIDICTDMPSENLDALFETIEEGDERFHTVGKIVQDGVTIHVLSNNIGTTASSDACVVKMTARLLEELEGYEELSYCMPSSFAFSAETYSKNDSGISMENGELRFLGLPEETLKKDYMRAYRIIRYAANYDMPIENNTWFCILRNASKMVKAVSLDIFLEEWRKVEAENMWKFMSLLFEFMILHELMPELIRLSRIEITLDDGQSKTNLWDHTLNVMKYYPEERPYDWLGVVTCLFHSVGKLYTAEYFQGRTKFIEHHQVGARVVRKILYKLRFSQDEIEYCSYLILNQVRFHFMLNDKGIRRFKSLNNYEELIVLAKAENRANNDNSSSFNHNMGMLKRADIKEELLEPLLNGKRIMELTGMTPGPFVGLIRDALLEAQKRGEIDSIESAKTFVLEYKAQEKF